MCVIEFCLIAVILILSSANLACWYYSYRSLSRLETPRGCGRLMQHERHDIVSLALQVENPGRQSLGGHDHATRVWQIGFTFVLDLEICDLAGVKRTRQFRCQGEVVVVEVDSELAFLV